MLKDFINICRMTQDELLRIIPVILSKTYDDVDATNDYIYAVGDIPVMLVAHLDTVHKNQPLNIWLSLDKDKIMAEEGIGGDDRCGVYSILRVIKAGYKPYVLFTTDEEIGGIGASKFCDKYSSLPVNCFIELDRKGSNDCVRYDDENEDLTNQFSKYGFKEAFGSFTDICILSDTYKISGVNLSVGYYNQHTNSEYVIMSELNNTITKVMDFLVDKSNYEHKYEYKNDIRNKYNIYGDYYLNRKYPCCCDICGNKIDLFKMNETPDGAMCDECYSIYESQYRTCPLCGELTYADDSICEWCGFEIGDDDSV